MKDNSIESTAGVKKFSLLLTLKALEQAGCESRPVRQIHIARMVDELGSRLKLDVRCDRKTVGRHIKLLGLVGYDVMSVKGKGYYIKSGIFTEKESKLLTELIGRADIPQGEKDALIGKVALRVQTLDVDKITEYFADKKDEED